MEKHEVKLNKLKNEYLRELRSEAVYHCLNHRLEYSKCIKESFFNRCNKYLKAFQVCADSRYTELKEENKEILEFKINRESYYRPYNHGLDPIKKDATMSLYFRSIVKSHKTGIILRTATSKADALTKELLLSAKDEKCEDRFRRAVKELEDFDTHWVQNLKEHRTISSIANDLVKHKKYNDFDFLINKMGISNCSIGMQTTTLKSYIERQIWKKAIPLFDELEDKVKHLRLYHDIIQGFSKDQAIEIAHKYLKKLLQRETQSSFKVSTKTSQITIEEFLKALSLSDTHKQLEFLDTALEYMQQGDYMANDGITSSLLSIFNRKDTVAVTTSMNDHASCEHCNTRLSGGGDFTDIYKEVCDNIENQMLQVGSHTHLQKMNQSFNNARFYHYVVDVANVLCTRSKNNQVNLERLKTILNSIVQHSKYDTRIVLVLPRGGTVKSIDLSRYLRHLCQSFVMNCHIDIIASRKLDEDLLVLYMAARSCYIAGKDVKVNIISNDQFSEYTGLVSDNQKGDMLKWLQSSVKRFDGDGTVSFKPYTASVVINEKQIHVRCEDDKIICAQLK